MPGRIFIVDDDAGFSQALVRSLRHGGHDVTACSTAAEARAQVDPEADVVVLDYQLPDADGLALLDELRPRAGGAVFLMATAFPDVEVAVEAMRRGAFDYVSKGADARECLLRIERGVEVSRLRHRIAESSGVVAGSSLEAEGLIGDSPPMRQLRQRLDALAASDDTTALILGETGTGKSVLARAIHAKSKRAFESFVAVDCTTIPATLVESELFGHEKGAFSGAIQSKMGRVEAAGRGTLFLDEIGELELPMQTKLLRLLEEREFTRVGSTKSRRLQSRVITATNRDLPRAVEEGRFRADLRYRLEVFVLEVPPLRERGNDVLVLASHFAQDRARALGRPVPSFAPQLASSLLAYPFPGNVRELKNMVEQAMLLSTGATLTTHEFPVLQRFVREPARTSSSPARPNGHSSVTPIHGHQASSSSSPSLGIAASMTSMAPARDTDRSPRTAVVGAHAMAVSPVPVQTEDGRAPTLSEIRRVSADRERESLVVALTATGGNVAAAARKLGMSRFQMLRRLAKYGLR